MKVRHRFLVWASLGLAPVALPAQLPNLGPEFPVNAFTTAKQRFPAVAAGPDGSFVVVWASDGQDGDLSGVFGQRFSPFGIKVGGEFQVNTNTTGNQLLPTVASDAQGNFVVAWQNTRDFAFTEIFAQRFDAGANKVGAEFHVSTNTFAERQPAVAAAPDGSFVVVWRFGYVPTSRIQGQKFDAAGAKVGGQFVLDTSTAPAQSDPAVATDAAGRFVVVWSTSDQSQDGSSAGVFGQRFDATAAKVGAAFQVNSYTTGKQEYPAIAMDRAGNFVVAWQSDLQDGDSFGIFGQRFNNGTEKVGPEFQANTYTTNAQEHTSVALEPDGGFVVAFRSFGEDGDSGAVAAQRFDRTGARRGPQLVPDEFVSGDQTNPKVATSPAGFLMVWQGLDGDQEGIRGKRLKLQPVSLLVDAHGEGNSDANGLIEPGEAVRVEPTWRNRGPGIVNLDGNVGASGFGGPPGPTYTLLDSFAEYPTMFVGQTAACNEDPGPCFAVQVSGARPAGAHWDATLTENLSLGGSQVWTLHVGDSFTDVPRSEPFYAKIETLLHNGVTLGCTPTQYCPGTVVSRGQMAIFIGKGIAGAGEYVPTSGLLSGQPYNCSAGGVSRFADVAPTDSFCRHVHYLSAQNVTLGCSASQYCPAQNVTRDAMASFIAKALVAPGGGNAVPLTYGPDPVTGFSYSCAVGTPNVHFSDVPVSHPFCKHIHFLWAKGIVSGCTATQYCPGGAVARDAMAKFLVNGFALKLYGP